MPRLALFAALLAALCLCLCASPAPAAAPEPCALLTQAQAQAVLGEAVKPPRPRKVAGMATGKSCTWFTAAPLAQRGGVGSIKLIMFDEKSMAGGPVYKDPAKYFARLREVTAKRSPVEDVSGLGKAAWWHPSGYMLHVLSPDGTYLQIKVQDLKKISAPSRAELNKKLSAHRKALAVGLARDYALPHLGGH